MKDKAVLVVDMPRCCAECPLFVHKDIEGDYECKIKDYDGLPIYYKEGNVDRPSYCPLSYIPEKKILRQYVSNAALNLESMLAYQYAQGYNSCIYDILERDN